MRFKYMYIFVVSPSLEHLVAMASSPAGKLKNQKEER
jgi:hypothetical protein